jgi:hypothetical protein
MAREAGFTEGEISFMGDNFMRFAELVRDDEREQGQKWFDAVTAQHKAEILAEREACAKVCDTVWNGDADTYEGAEASNDCAAAIRERGNT